MSDFNYCTEITQTGITDFSTGTDSTDTPPKPVIKKATNDISDTDDSNECEVVALIQAWAEKTFREEARKTLEALYYIDEDRHGEIIDELVESPDTPIEIQLNSNICAQLHAHRASMGTKDAAIGSDATQTDLLTHGITALGGDIEDIRERINKLLDAGVTINLPGGKIEPDAAEGVDVLLAGIDNAGDTLITETGATELVNAAESYTGRPPIGFEAENGQLQKTDNYHDVRAALKAVIAEESSKAAAARQIDCAPKTITRAIEDHPERYQL